MSVLNLSITTGRPDAELITRYESGKGPKAIAQSLADFVLGVSSGTELAASTSAPPSLAISVQGNTTAASGTVTFSAAATADDTVLVNGVTFTAAATGATGNQWNVGATLVDSATNLAASISGSVTALVTGVVTAVGASGVVTISALTGGVSGNLITIAEGVDAGNVMTVSGARLTGGAADATAVTLSF